MGNVEGVGGGASPGLVDGWTLFRVLVPVWILWPHNPEVTGGTGGEGGVAGTGYMVDVGGGASPGLGDGWTLFRVGSGVAFVLPSGVPPVSIPLWPFLLLLSGGAAGGGCDSYGGYDACVCGTAVHCWWTTRLEGFV